MTETIENKGGQARWRVYALFGIIVLGAALGNLSQTGLNAMMPSVMLDLGVEVGTGQWLTTGYMLVMGVAVPVATFLMKRLDDRGYLLLSFGMFTLGSLGDVVAPEFYSAFAGRVLQAVAVGLLVPKMQTIAMTQFAPGRQATAMGVAGIALGFAPNIGPTAGGALDFAFGWRSFFVAQFGVSLGLLIMAALLVERGRALDAGARFETVSFVYSTIGFGGVLLGLSQASSYGLRSAWMWAPIAVGAVFLALFVRRQRAIDDPLIDLRIFDSRIFSDGLLTSVFLYSCFIGITLVIPLYVQGVQGGTSLDSGLVILPTTVTALLVNPLAGMLADKTSARLACLIFGAFLVVGSVAYVFVQPDTPFWFLATFQTLRGIGVSGLIGPLVTYSLAGLEGPLVSHGSTAMVIVRQVAATFSTAVMVLCIAMFGSLAAEGAVPAVLPYQVAFGFSALMAVLCLIFVVAKVKTR